MPLICAPRWATSAALSMWRRGSPPRGKLFAFKQPELMAEAAKTPGQPAEPPRMVLAENLDWFGARPITRPRLPSLQEAAAALGALYAVEGSIPGAPLIAQRLPLSLAWLRPGRH